MPRSTAPPAPVRVDEPVVAPVVPVAPVAPVMPVEVRSPAAEEVGVETALFDEERVPVVESMCEPDAAPAAADATRSPAEECVGVWVLWVVSLPADLSVALSTAALAALPVRPPPVLSLADS